jgi:hypothetical protein
MEYEAADVASHSEDTDFRHQFFTIPGAGVSSDSEQHQLAAVLWSQGQNLPGSIPRPLVLYLHTNTRCLLDAKEVLPVCDELGASLLAFDLPGCGHSEGTLTFQMTQVGSCASCRYIIHNYLLSQSFGHFKLSWLHLLARLPLHRT